MKRWILGLALAVGVSGAVHAEGRIATIDLRKAFDNYWKKQKAEATLKDEKADIDKEVKNMLDDLKKAKEAYQKLLNDANDQAVSAEEREKRKKLAEDKLKDAKSIEDTAVQMDRQRNAILDEKRQRVRDNLIAEIRNVVSAKARTAGYSLVMDIAAETANRTPVVLYTDNQTDLTDEVLKQLNAGAPVESPKSDEKKEEKKTDKTEKSEKSKK